MEMENMTCKDVVLDRKLDKYSFEGNDFLASGELTVTITLSEYRQLLRENATTDSRIKDAEKDKWDRESENNSLKKENAELKAELYEMKKAQDKAAGKAEPEDDDEATGTLL